MNTETTATTDIALLPPAERAVKILGSTKTEADLKAMVAEAKTVTQVTDKDTRELAHRTAMKLKNARVTIEKTGKAAREDATAFSKAVIDEEKRLKAIAADEEDRVFKLRDDYDAAIRKEEEDRQRAIEAKRAEVRLKIDGIKGLPTACLNETAERIKEEWYALSDFVPLADVFGDQLDDCKVAITETLTALDNLHAQVNAREQAEAQLAIEREAAAARQKEIDEAIRAEREKAAAEAKAKDDEIAALRAQLAAKPAVVLNPDDPSQLPPGTLYHKPLKYTLSDGIEREVMAFGATPDEPAVVDLINLDDAKPGDIIRMPDQEFGANQTIDTPVIAEAKNQEATDMLVAVIGVDMAPTDFRIRQIALATSDQFAAMAQKVEAVGFTAFAADLRAVALALKEGQHDDKLSATDPSALLAADYNMADATEMAIRSINEVMEAV